MLDRLRGKLRSMPDRFRARWELGRQRPHADLDAARDVKAELLTDARPDRQAARVAVERALETLIFDRLERTHVSELELMRGLDGPVSTAPLARVGLGTVAAVLRAGPEGVRAAVYGFGEKRANRVVAAAEVVLRDVRDQARAEFHLVRDLAEHEALVVAVAHFLAQQENLSALTRDVDRVVRSIDELLERSAVRDHWYSWQAATDDERGRACDTVEPLERLLASPTVAQLRRRLKDARAVEPVEDIWRVYDYKPHLFERTINELLDELDAYGSNDDG